jgi:hypothetical protein
MAFITIAGEQLIAQKQGASQVLSITQFVLANIAGLGVEPANRIEALPAAGNIVGTYAVTFQGYVNSNQVVYSLSLDSTIGDYDFNWVGLKSAEGTLVACEHIALTQKRHTVGAVAGNNLTRNFLLAFSGATATTSISVPASTWQIDFTTRLLQVDDRERLSNMDDYGTAAFYDNAQLVTLSSGTTYNIAPGVSYISGIRCETTVLTALNVGALPKAIWMDASLQGNINGVAPVIVFTASATSLSNNTDGQGFKHYLFKIADISSGGAITDLRQGVVVSQPEAIAGISTVIRRWNALRVRQAAMSAMQLPVYALDLPIINSTNNTIAVTANIIAGTGGTASISAGTKFTLAKFVSSGLGTVQEYITPAFTTPTLAIASKYFLRAYINSSDQLTFYVQIGDINDSTPAGLVGVENGASGGGFYSTPFDICIAQIITGTSGTAPAIRPVVNSKNNLWSQKLVGGGTVYLPFDPYILNGRLIAAITDPHASLVSNIIHGSSGWSYTSYVHMSPIPAGGIQNTANFVSSYTLNAASIILSSNVVGDMGLSTVDMSFFHTNSKMVTKTHQAEHMITGLDSTGGDEQLLAVGLKTLQAIDYSSGIAVTYSNCVGASIQWEISR